MVAHILRLRLLLLANSFRRSAWQVVGLLLALMYGLGASSLGALALVGLRVVPADVAAPLVTVAGSILVLGFLVVPLVFGVDDALDPRRFGLFGIPTAKLAAALAAAALIGVPALAVTLVALAQVVTWTRGGLAVFVALISAAVILATCVLGARVTTSIAAFLLSSRRARDITAVLGLIVLLSLSPIFLLVLNVDWARDGLGILDGIAGVVGWTPLGAAWAAPGAIAAGDVGGGILKLVVALAFAAGLWYGWRALVGFMLVTQERLAEAKEYSGLGFFGAFPSSATGVVAARSLTYWVRDARYHVSLVVIPIIPFVLIVPLMIAGVPAGPLTLLPVPVMALFLSWSIHNDVAYDSTAMWVHVAAAIRGRSDRLGRTIPALLVGFPLLIVGSIVCTALYGDARALPVLLGVGIGILLSGLGLSSVMSARFPYPAVRPGDSPFVQPQSSGSASALIQSLSFFATALLSVPAILLGLQGLGGSTTAAWWALVVGLLVGSLSFVGGITWGGRIFDRRAPDLLAFTMRN